MKFRVILQTFPVLLWSNIFNEMTILIILRRNTVNSQMCPKLLYCMRCTLIHWHHSHWGSICCSRTLQLVQENFLTFPLLILFLSDSLTCMCFYLHWTWAGVQNTRKFQPQERSAALNRERERQREKTIHYVWRNEESLLNLYPEFEFECKSTSKCETNKI